MTFPAQKEIADRLRARKDDDFFGFETSEYFLSLDRDHVREFAKEDADLSDWEPSFVTVDDVKERLLDYMEFAWDKANGCRGISANRSVMHIIAWLWLMGGKYRAFSDVVEEMFENHYEHYGKGILATVSEFMGVNWRAYDNDNWTSYEGERGDLAYAAFENWSGRRLAEPYLNPQEGPN